MIGIDVSNWQGAIDWNAVAAWRGPNGERIEFAAIRATEGASGSNPSFALDPFFVANWDGCKAVGIARIAYHFARPAWNSAQTELDWHLSQVNYLPGDGCMLDFEDPNAVGDLCGWASGWVQGFDQRQGFWPFFYSGLWYMQPHNLIGCAGLANDGLALADYTFAPHASLPPSPWPVTAITQYSDNGSVGGISGGVDMDFFNGDASQLAKYFKAGQAVPAAPTTTTRRVTMVVFQAEEDGAQFVVGGTGRRGPQLTSPVQSAALVAAGVPIEIVPRSTIDLFEPDGPLLVRDPTTGGVYSNTAPWRHILPEEFALYRREEAEVEEIDAATVAEIVPPPAK